jgi:ligand-binding sensor domain-containing protein
MRWWFWAGMLIAGLGLFVPPALGQNVQDSFTPYVNATDLQALERDGKGNLWIASNGGALRFGLANHDWEVFPRLLGTGPRGNDLVTLCVDTQGRIWVGSATRGFTFYNPATHIWDRESEEWPDPRIRVTRCLGGGVYIGTAGGLSLKPTPNRTDICAAADPGCIVPSYVVNDFALLGDTLWVATEGGLGRFNGATWDSASALPPGSIGQQSRSLAVYAGELWEVTGLNRVRWLHNGTWISASLPSVTRVVVRENQLYALGGHRIFRLQAGSWVDMNPPLGIYDDVRDLEVFGQDMYLALNVGLGLWRGGPSLAERFIPPGPRFSGAYSGIAVDSRGRVWAGTSEQSVGLVKFDGSTWEGIAPFEAGLGEGEIRAMLSDSKDQIWLGHCCCHVDPDTCLLQRVEIDSTIGRINGVRNVRDFKEDAQGRIWMGTDGYGVMVRDATGPLFDLTILNTGGAMSSDIVRAVAAMSDYAYIGNESEGLDIWPHHGNLNSGRDGSNWIHLGDTTFPGLLDGSVRGMTFRDGELWVATVSGLHHLLGTEILDRCPARDRELPGDFTRLVNAVAADRLGGLWVGTESGLLYLPKGGACDGAGGDFLSFTVDNSALPDNRVLSAALNPLDGSMWFGTAEGILRVDPLAFSGSPPPPDKYVLYPNPVYPSSGESSRRIAIFGIERGGIRVEAVPSTEATQPRVYDLTGNHVGDFELATSGSKTYWLWRATNTNGDVVAPGIYLVQSDVGGTTVLLKMGVLR